MENAETIAKLVDDLGLSRLDAMTEQAFDDQLYSVSMSFGAAFWYNS